MKRFKVLLAAAILCMGLTACASKEEETVPETEPDTQAQVETTADSEETESETEKPAYQRPENEEIITYMPLEIDGEATERFVGGENPHYDAEKKQLVFVVTTEIEYEADEECSVGISSTEEAYTVDGTLLPDAYEELASMNGYRGAAIQLEEALEPGDYRFVINFSTYTISFAYTVK